jgi:hypothetical protein
MMASAQLQLAPPACLTMWLLQLRTSSFSNLLHPPKKSLGERLFDGAFQPGVAQKRGQDV